MLYIGIDIIGGQNHLAWSDDSTQSHRIEHFKSEQKLYERLRELVLQGGGMYEIAKSYYVFDGATNLRQDRNQFRIDIDQKVGVSPKSLCLLPISIAVASSISLPKGNNIICHYNKRELITQTIKIENNEDINELITKHDEELGEDSIVRIFKDFMLQLYGVQISDAEAYSILKNLLGEESYICNNSRIFLLNKDIEKALRKSGYVQRFIKNLIDAYIESGFISKSQTNVIMISDRISSDMVKKYLSLLSNNISMPQNPMTCVVTGCRNYLTGSKPFIIDRLQTDVEVHLSPNEVRILPCMTPISEICIAFKAKNAIDCNVGNNKYTLTFNDVIDQSKNVTDIRLQFLYDNHQLKAKLDFIDFNEKIIAQREFKL